MKLRPSVTIGFATWLLLLLMMPAAAAPRQVMRGHVPAVVAGLKPTGDFPGTNHLNLAIGLPLRNQEALTNLLRQIYDPASSNYHHYLTPEQFTEQFGPTEKDYQAVIAFAKANGLTVTGTDPTRMLVDVSGSVADIERALHVTLRVYQHPTEKRMFHAPDAEPSLDLAVPILRISGLDNYSLPRPRLQATPLANASKTLPNAGSGPGGAYMGKDFRAAYVPDSSLNGSGQIVGLLQFDGYTASDITYYENHAGLPSITLSNVLIDGASGNPSGSGGEVEVSLDIEMAISMATNLSKVIVYMAPNPSPWEDLLKRMANDNLAKQLSCSWYEPGGAANTNADQIFLQMAAQGQSFFNASGDSDAYTGLIDFPGDTPYLTQVGGTTLSTTGSGGSWTSETVWNRGNGIGSGGGISTQYPISAWQTNINMTASQGSTTKRNTPDVALTADNVYVRADGADYNVGGTSCAAPLWAGFAALINQQAAATGKPPIGFVNPAIYAIGAATNYTSVFHDITTGNNESPSSPTKFSAVGGYDLCTGWGTPAGQSLINALAPLVIVTLPPSATEGDGLLAGAGQIQLPTVQTSDVVIGLTSSDPAQVTVPANVTVFTGQSNAVFDLTILDDGVLDGTQTATVTASVPGAGTGSASMTIFDKETATLQLSLPQAVTKGQGAVQGTVQVSAAVAADVTVGLSSSSTNLIQVPASVIIPSGQTSAVFTATILTDGQINGGQTVNITAHVQNWTDGVAAVTVQDNVNLTITLPATAWKNAGVLVNAGSVSMAGISVANEVISLTSSKPAVLTVPSAVTILAGSTSNTFNITLINNGIAQSNQTVTVTASASAFTNGATSILVLNPGLPPIPSNPQPGNLATNVLANTNLMWSNSANSSTSELILNGGFEAGSLTNWTVVPSTSGRFVINNGTVDPPGPDGPLPPFAGSYSALGEESGPGIFYMYQTISIPTNATSVTLSWAHRVRNFYSSFSSSQQFQVRICDTNNNVLATPFTTNPGDPLLGNWIQTNYDLTSFAGKTVRVLFWVDSGSYYLDVHVDSVSVQVNALYSASELVLNGGFETGTFTNWFKTNSTTAGDWVINNGTYVPPGSDGTSQPFAGNYSALSEQTGPGTHVLYQDVTIPSGASSATLTWVDRIHNHGSQFTTTSQYFHAEIRGTNNTVLQVAFTTKPGDPLITNWVARSFDLSSYIGQKIRVAFVESDSLGFFNVGLDNISVQVNALSVTNSSGIVTSDVYFGTNPTPGLAQFQGNTTNSSWTLPLLAPLTTYYWQIVAHGEGITTGPVWQFTTAGADHFVWNTISSPQYVSQPFSTTVTAKDAFNTTVSNFTGRVGLSGWSGSSGLGQPVTFDDLSGSGLPVPIGYGGLTWSNFSYLIGADHPNSGYSAGTVSPPNAAYNPYGTPASIISTGLVNFVSAFLTAAWNDNLQVQVKGYSGATLVYSNSYTLSATAPTLINFNYLGVNKVDFISSGGTPHPGYSGSGTHFVMDNVVIGGSAAPPVSITPTNSGNFVNGAWTGNVTVQQPATNVVLQADDGNQHIGSSNPFNVVLTNDISVSIVDSPDPVSVGANLTYTLTVANAGPLDATGVMVTNILPPSVAFVSATSSQGTCAQNGGVVACNLGVVPGATNATITIVVVPTIAGIIITNVATVSRAEADNYLGNNTATAVTTVTTPAISIADASVIEGNVGTMNMIFVVTLAAPSAQTITVNYATSDGSATAGSDYIATNGTVTFAPGITSATIAVAVIGDTVIETNETFFVNLSNPVNGTLGRSQGVGTIINDDGFPGEVDHFTWSVIASPQYTNVPFGVTINAWDALNNPVTNFTGAVSLYSTSNHVVPVVSDNFTNGIWSGNVAVLNRATNAVLVADDGNGHTGLSNPFDVVPANMPPVILAQPTDQTVIVGGTATFTVVADGTPPLGYQWNFNGTNIVGATNTPLTLSNVQFSQAGSYAVLVTNVFGSVLSSNAVLTVNLPPAVPAITGFSPIAGSAGTSVTIFGTNFSPVASNNIVYFGAVQAGVVSASVTNLVVPVPVGATYAPITETVNGLVAFANTAFEPTFPGDGSDIGPSSFAPRVDMACGSGPYLTSIADLDGDGKPDLVAVNYYDGNISLFRNISTNGTLSFAPRVDLPSFGGAPLGFAVADVDGDGKLDLVVSDSSNNRVLVYRNISTVGTLTTNSFAAPVAFSAGNSPAAVRVRDLDGDGKPDIVCVNSGDNTLSILRNIGTAGSLTTNSFAAQVVLATGPNPSDLVIADLDGDGKPDLVQVNYTPSFFSVFRNTSVPGGIDTNSFAARVDFATSGEGNSIIVGDVDGDGKPDVVVGLASGSAISVYRNLASPGTLDTNSFAAEVDFPAPGWVRGVAMGDLNGDGKLDISLVGEEGNFMSVYQNVSTPGSFTNTSLASRVDYGAGWNPHGVAIGDLDGDGRPDIIFGNQYDSTISIYRNVMPFGSAPIITAQPTNQTVVVGGTTNFSVTASGTPPLSYQWNFNGTNIVGATNTTLTLINVQVRQAGNYAVLVTNVYGSATSIVATLSVAISPVIASQPKNQFVPLGCDATFNVCAWGTKPLSYQWWKDGLALSGQTNMSLTLTNVQTSDFGSYSVVVTNDFGSVTSSPAQLALGHPPVANPDTIYRFASGGVRVNVGGLLANDTDPDGDSLTIIGVSPNSAAGGTVGLTNNWIYYAPPGGSANGDTFTYIVSDGHCGTDVGTVTVQIKADNPQPLTFAIANPGDGFIRLTFDGIPGYTYRIEYTDDLSNPDWQTLNTETADSFGVCQFVDGSLTNAPARFYRAVWP
jgi:uncharacterized repeat protein (TIGR01451 family)